MVAVDFNEQIMRGYALEDGEIDDDDDDALGLGGQVVKKRKLSEDKVV